MMFPHLSHTRASRPHIGSKVLVPITRPQSATHLVRAASAIAGPERGELLPVKVLSAESDEHMRTEAKTLLQQAEAAALDAGSEASPTLRVAASVAEGVLHCAVEQGVSLILLGWPSQETNGPGLASPVGEIVEDTPAPVVVARLDGHGWEQVVLRPPKGQHVREPELASLRLAAEISRRMADVHGIPLVLSRPPADEDACALLDGIPVDADLAAEDVIGRADVLTVASVAPQLVALDMAVARTRDHGDVMAVLAHGPSRPEPRLLLPSAERLYGGGGPQEPATAPS